MLLFSSNVWQRGDTVRANLSRDPRRTRRAAAYQRESPYPMHLLAINASHFTCLCFPPCQESKEDTEKETAPVPSDGVKEVAFPSRRPSLGRRASTSSIGVKRGITTRQSSFFWKAGMPRWVGGGWVGGWVGRRAGGRSGHESRSGFGGGIRCDVGGTV